MVAAAAKGLAAHAIEQAATTKAKDKDRINGPTNRMSRPASVARRRGRVRIKGKRRRFAENVGLGLVGRLSLGGHVFTGQYGVDLFFQRLGDVGAIADVNAPHDPRLINQHQGWDALDIIGPCRLALSIKHYRHVELLFIKKRTDR